MVEIFEQAERNAEEGGPPYYLPALMNLLPEGDRED